MELIKAELSEFTRRSRSFAVTHGETGLSRGLEHGERVLVLTGGEYRTAVVADIEFDLDETHYRFILGGPVPADIAEDRLLGEINVHPGAGPGRVSVHDVADLLARSGAAHRIPQQRQVARRLLDR
ncbi:MAG: hypothetical protein JWQ74_1967 [Marmoricola sp.]|nr:hypothetical protein [Marmoricola sp.]